ncbi:MAG: PQQ-binding-like beta-propeller repeat protein [Thermoflexales bacterium]|nr:PQQ-binding-like beta-propeller repeat protein [Thermoflexales bacterium]
MTSLLGVGSAFFLPTLSGRQATWLDDVWPLRSGAARLEVILDAQRQIRGWRSLNLVLLPPLRGAASDLHPVLGQAVLVHYAAYRPGGDLSFQSLSQEIRQRHTRLFVQRERTLTTDGALYAHEDVYIRDPQGQFWVGRAFSEELPPLTFDPPILWLPPTQATSVWSTTGQTNAGAAYTHTAQVVHRRSGCTWVSWLLHIEATPAQRWAATDQICAGSGVVAREETDAQGTVLQRFEAASADAFPPPAAISAQEERPLSLPERWELKLVAKANLSGAEIESTIPLVWVETTPPLLLAAAVNGDLIAFDPQSQAVRIAWRFRTGGSIYSLPAVDAATGRIYFGSTDKRLYALDARGLFVWSFATGDNVAAQPLIVDVGGDQGRLVIVGSEDGAIYALDAASGKLRWRHALGAPVAASAVAYRLGETLLAAAGNDNGDVVALNVRTGEPVWTRALPGAVVGAIRATQAQLFVAVRSGEVVALDASSGEVRWQAQLKALLARAPALGQDFVAVVDTDGVLSVFDQASGALRWRESSYAYTAAPLVLSRPGLGEALLVADREGGLTLFSADGAKLRRWQTSTLVAPQETSDRYDFIHTPTRGGNALWAVNAATLVWRLGE